MIHINLVRDKKPKYVVGAKPDRASSGSNFFKFFGGDAGKNMGIVLAYIAIPVGIAFGAHYLYEDYLTTLRAEMKGELEAIQKDSSALDLQLAAQKKQEVIDEQLRKNFEVIRSKIETIEKLIQGREIVGKSLINLAQALPKEAWLTEYSLNDKVYRISGMSLDAGLITDYMSRLQKSIYFKDVQLERSAASDSKGPKTEFQLTGKVEE